MIDLSACSIQTEGGNDLKLCWDLVVRQDNAWYNAFVAQDGDVVALYDWVADDTYLVPSV